MTERTLSRPRAYRRTPRWVFWLRRSIAAALTLVIVTTSWSLISVLRAPGTDDAPTRLAEWSRDHYLGPLVTLAETAQYKLNPPVTGGSPDTSLLAQAANSVDAATTTDGSNSTIASNAVTSTTPANAAIATNATKRPSTLVSIQIPTQPPIHTPVTPSLPGEGRFVHAASTSAGPALQIAYVRPDSIHTSYLTGVAWMSHTLHFVLHPGYEDPGTAGMSQPDLITPSAFPGLMATFNGGFKMKDANGGYYDNGHFAAPLVKGAASFVIYKDGHATVGTWGNDVHMGPKVAFVRQNLQPLITKGKLAPNLSSNVQSNWGATIGGAYYVWRSGIGITKSGDLVYVMGDALSVSSLADILHRAGAVTAMQLDINRAWTSFMYYKHPTSTTVKPHKMGTFNRPVERYLQDTSRDFFAVYDPKVA